MGARWRSVRAPLTGFASVGTWTRDANYKYPGASSRQLDRRLVGACRSVFVAGARATALACMFSGVSGQPQVPDGDAQGADGRQECHTAVDGAGRRRRRRAGGGRRQHCAGGRARRLLARAAGRGHRLSGRGGARLGPLRRAAPAHERRAARRRSVPPARPRRRSCTRNHRRRSPPSRSSPSPRSSPPRPDRLVPRWSASAPCSPSSTSPRWSPS